MRVSYSISRDKGMHGGPCHLSINNGSQVLAQVKGGGCSVQPRHTYAWLAKNKAHRHPATGIIVPTCGKMEEVGKDVILKLLAIIEKDGGYLCGTAKNLIEDKQCTNLQKSSKKKDIG
jgi:hypothetical protein